VAANILNVMLGNVGKTVNIAQMSIPRSSASDLAAAINDMRQGNVDVLFTYGSNPAFTFPAAHGYDYAVNQVSIKDGDKKAGLVVAFSSFLDETSQLADYILPVHTGLEDWGYTRPSKDAISLIQPSMRPVFDTQSVGDVLLTIASNANKAVVPADVTSFDKFVKANFLSATSAQAGSNTEKFWMASLEARRFRSILLSSSCRSESRIRTSTTMSLSSIRIHQ
jgi:molybdopterin-containing oxidoreductase family iron-sulfur binding subunit